METGKSVIAAGVFNSGLLSRDWPTQGMKYDYRDASQELVERARAIAEICQRHGTSLPAAAIAFPFTHPAVINVTLGMANPDQVNQNVQMSRQHIPTALWSDLRARKLIKFGVAAPPRCL